MGWVRISDDFYDHRKFEDVGPLGIAMWTAGLAWCNRNLSDGRIPRSVALRLLDWEGVSDVLAKAESNAGSNGVSNGRSNSPRNSDVALEVARMLVEARLWGFDEGGYVVVAYLNYQRSAEQIKADAEANAARQARFRATRRGAKSNGDRNAVTNGDVTRCPNPNPNPIVLPPSEEERKDSSSASPPIKPGNSSAFDEFYDAYPKKVGKDAARTAFTNAVTKKGATPQQLIEAAKAFAVACRDGSADRQLTAGPGPWLNQGYWRDDPRDHVHRGNSSATNQASLRFENYTDDNPYGDMDPER